MAGSHWGISHVCIRRRPRGMDMSRSHARLCRFVTIVVRSFGGSWLINFRRRRTHGLPIHVLFPAKPSLVDKPARGWRAGARAKGKVLDDVVHSRLWVAHVVELVRPTTVKVGKSSTVQISCPYLYHSHLQPVSYIGDQARLSLALASISETLSDETQTEREGKMIMFKEVND
jgi:hypothetical protein